MNRERSARYRFTIGSYDCLALSDGVLSYSWKTLFDNVSASTLELLLAERGISSADVQLASSCLLVETGAQRILIDTGSARPARSHVGVRRGLRDAGIAPEEIDLVLLSHAHERRAGGALDGRERPAYTNARYALWREEWEFWAGEPDLRTRGLQRMTDSARKTLRALGDRLELVERGAEVAPGVRLVAAPGHTAGHVGVSVASRGERLLYVSDAVYHPIHCEHPEWYSSLDLRPEQSVTSRLRLLDRAVAEDALVFAPRFAFPSLGRVVQQGAAWLWLPAAPAMPPDDVARVSVAARTAGGG